MVDKLEGLVWLISWQATRGLPNTYFEEFMGMGHNFISNHPKRVGEYPSSQTSDWSSWGCSPGVKGTASTYGHISLPISSSHFIVLWELLLYACLYMIIGFGLSCAMSCCMDSFVFGLQYWHTLIQFTSISVYPVYSGLVLLLLMMRLVLFIFVVVAAAISKDIATGWLWLGSSTTRYLRQQLVG